MTAGSRPEKKRDRERGQALVELALVLTILLALLMGTIDIGRALHTYLVLEHASREGARAGALGQGDLQIDSTVRNALSPVVDRTKVVVAVTPPESARARGTPVSVRVTYPMQYLFPYLQSLLGPLDLAGETIMRVE